MLKRSRELCIVEPGVDTAKKLRTDFEADPTWPSLFCALEADHFELSKERRKADECADRKSVIELTELCSYVDSPCSSKDNSPRSTKRSITWSKYNIVKLDNEIFHLPRRFRNGEFVSSGELEAKCTAADLCSLENVLISRIKPTHSKLEQVAFHMKNSRIRPHLNITQIREAYEHESHLYIVKELMDGTMSEIVNDNVDHFVISKMMEQLLNAVQHIHIGGYGHGEINIATIKVNTDAFVKLDGYGKREKLTEQRALYDYRCIGLVLAQFLLDETEKYNYSLTVDKSDDSSEAISPVEAASPTVIQSTNEQNDFADSEEFLKGIDFDTITSWKPIMEHAALGLTDMNARSLLKVLLSSPTVSDMEKTLADHPYLVTFSILRKSDEEEALIDGIEPVPNDVPFDGELGPLTVIRQELVHFDTANQKFDEEYWGK